LSSFIFAVTFRCLKKILLAFCVLLCKTKQESKAKRKKQSKNAKQEKELVSANISFTNVSRKKQTSKVLYKAAKLRSNKTLLFFFYLQYFAFNKVFLIKKRKIPFGNEVTNLQYFYWNVYHHLKRVYALFDSANLCNSSRFWRALPDFFNASNSSSDKDS